MNDIWKYKKPGKLKTRTSCFRNQSSIVKKRMTYSVTSLLHQNQPLNHQLNIRQPAACKDSIFPSLQAQAEGGGCPGYLS